MTNQEWKKIARILKEIYAKLEEEALEGGLDIFSQEYTDLLNKAREKVLTNLGYTVEEYLEMKEKISSARKIDVDKKIAEVSEKIDNLPKPQPIPTKEEIMEIAHEVAKEYIKPPQITNQIVKETTHEVIKEQPQILETVRVERIEEKYDDEKLLKALATLESKVAEIVIPDTEEIKEELSFELQKNIDLLGMPDFRKLGMGLQQQIDEIKNEDSFNPVDTLEYNTSYTPTGSEPTGANYWDVDNHTVSTVLENGVVLQNGQEVHIYGKNISGGIIYNGTPVAIVASNGSFTAFGTVDITTASSAYAFVGLATQDIGINEFGYVTKIGVVRSIDTSALDEGKPVYVSASGGLTKTYPTVPNYVINVGMCEYKHANQGRINVIPLIVPKLNDLSDVDGTALTTTGQFPSWNQTAGYFDFDKNINDYQKSLVLVGSGAGTNTSSATHARIASVEGDNWNLIIDFTGLVDSNKSKSRVILKCKDGVLSGYNVDFNYIAAYPINHLYVDKDNTTGIYYIRIYTVAGTNRSSTWNVYREEADTAIVSVNSSYVANGTGYTNQISVPYFMVYAVVNLGSYYGSLIGNASSSTYSNYVGGGGYTLSNSTDKTGLWEYFGYFTLTYNSNYRGGHSSNFIIWLSENSRNIKSAENLEYIRLDCAINLSAFANSTQFDTTTPTLDIKVYGSTTLTGDDFACLVYTTSTSSKDVRFYVKLKDADTNYSIIAIDHRGRRYTISGGQTTDGGFVYANEQATVASLPTPAQGSIVYGVKKTHDDLSGLVPYTGATTTLNLGAQDFSTSGYINGLSIGKQTNGFTIEGGQIVNAKFSVTESSTINGGTHSGTNTGDQTITLTGDVTGSGTGSFVTTIANDAVTYAKMQNVSATDKILGRASAGAGDVEEITCTAAGRAILDDATANDQRTTLGVGTGNSPQFTAVNIGHASDTTLSRSAAGVIAVEGTSIPKGTGTSNEIAYWSGTNTVASLAVATYPSLTELSYVKGVSSSIQTQLGGKQATLVSGTNIKTINSTTLLGSGDISITPNATHTGDVTGATALTVDKSAITGKTAVTAVGTDYVLISDTSDSGNLKKALASDFAGGGGVSDGDKGEITVASSGTVWTVDKDLITNKAETSSAIDDFVLFSDTSDSGNLQKCKPKNLKVVDSANTGDIPWVNSGLLGGGAPISTDGINYVWLGDRYSTGNVNDTKFANDGFQTMIGEARPWKEVGSWLFPKEGVSSFADSLNGGFDAPDVAYGFGGVSGNPYYKMLYDSELEQQTKIPFEIKIPDDYDIGSQCYWHIHFSLEPDSQAMHTGLVAFNIEYCYAQEQPSCYDVYNFTTTDTKVFSCSDATSSDYFPHLVTVHDDDMDLVTFNYTKNEILRGFISLHGNTTYDGYVIPLKVEIDYRIGELGQYKHREVV